MRRLLSALPLLVLLLAFGVAAAFGVGGVLSWQEIAAREAELQGAVATHPVLAPLAYCMLYVAVAALAIPQAALLSIAGGLLFGPALAVACIVPGATAGAVLLFLGARTALGSPLRRRAAPLLERVRPGLERDGFSYLLSLRLLPVVPFWLVNLGAGLAGMRLLPFAAATAIGIVPGALFLATIGAGLGDAVASGAAPDPWSILTPRILIERCGLALLALAPVLWRRWRRKHG